MSLHFACTGSPSPCISKQVPLCYNLHCWTGNACLDSSLQHPKMHPTSFCTAKICYRFNLILPILKVDYNALRVKVRGLMFFHYSIRVHSRCPFSPFQKHFRNVLKLISLTISTDAKHSNIPTIPIFSWGNFQHQSLCGVEYILIMHGTLENAETLQR